MCFSRLLSVPERHEGDCQRNADATNIAVQSEDNSKDYIPVTGIFAFDSATALPVHEGSPHTGKARKHTCKIASVFDILVGFESPRCVGESALPF